MGPSSRFRNGPIGKLNHFLTITLIEWIGNFYRRVCGNRSSATCDRLCVYFMEEKNPVLLIVYLTLLTGSILLFFLTAWPHFPGHYLSQVHMYLVPIVIFFTYASFFTACMSDPGQITRENVIKACKMFDYDFLIFEPRECKTCLFLKPARSKHCSLCKMCVAKCDHHCSWINNCVGLKNHRYFLLFLYATVQICFYGAYLIYYIFWGIAKKMNLSDAWITSIQTGIRVRISTYQAALFLIHQERVLGALGIFALLVGLVIFIFFCYQLSLVYNGTTANEAFKWEELEEIIISGELWVFEKDTEEESKKRKKKNKSKEISEVKGKTTAVYWIQPAKRRKNVSSEGESEAIGENSKQIGRQVKSISEVRNIYDKGLWGNFKEALSPPSL
ncbi:DHHC palmitoyltransferase-domain-containing protein [Glomus cerebriforme]|uniref:Palmitoyltransferase n=1 Tax=Glomus cerebriforme TaxID=658196 RepID=A0A397TMQ7_9GLOM|nr:DHHC palmitoyltransferase-domain-containing protein [Glomus cerebriforme]